MLKLTTLGSACAERGENYYQTILIFSVDVERSEAVWTIYLIKFGDLELVSYLCAMKVREVIAYKNYFEDFLLAQPQKVQDKIFKIIETIETLERVPSEKNTTNTTERDRQSD
jgi:hypothetical protein